MAQLQKVKRVRPDFNDGDPRQLELAIAYLDRDEYRYGSGYVKEYIWRRLGRFTLKESQKERLRGVALQYLDRTMTREFWDMCRFVSGIADEPLRNQVRHLIAAEDNAVCQRAVILLEYLKNREAGERCRRGFHRQGSAERWAH